MIVRLDSSALKQTKWHEYGVRFLLGGLITAMAGLITERYGPVIGGLFLAFPAILPCTVTLVAKHERERKRREGLDGTQRGISAAAIDAAGAALGSVGLGVFAGCVWTLAASHSAAAVLGAAAAAWLVVGVLVWMGWRLRHRRRVCRRSGRSGGWEARQ